MPLHFPILIGLSKCTPGLSIPARVSDKNDLCRAFGNTLFLSPKRMACQSSAAECNGEQSRCFGFSGRSRGNACPPFSAPVCLCLSFIGAIFLFRTVKLYRHAGTPTLRGQTQTRRLHDTWAVSHGLHTWARIPQHVRERALGEGHHRGANLICVFFMLRIPTVLVFSHLLSP